MHANASIDALLQEMNRGSSGRIDLSLDRIERLLAALGNPQHTLPSVIHLAGTNGKGSTLAFLRAMFAGAGLHVHAYTSPHLVRFNERMWLDGAEISDAALLKHLQRVTDTSVEITFFEATTAAAFLAFSETPADVLLLETGLGGRLDATNVVSKPLVTVITPIDFDHKEFLGESLAAIAGEKAGIMKAGVPCISGQQLPEAQDVLIAKAAERGCPLILHGRDWQYQESNAHLEVRCGEAIWHLPLPHLPGAHQYHNAALASIVAHVSGLEHQREAISTADWPARLQKLTFGPLVDLWKGEVYLDGGHNPHAAAALAAWAGEAPIALLVGMMKRKDAAAFFAPLVPHIQALAAIPIAEEACYAPQELADIARAAGIAHAMHAQKPEEGAALLLQECQPCRLLIGGSLFLAGEILKTHG